ncbi:MAG: MBL fold metallo-hydrolase, partial [Chloroflexi bacterium]|nr:MBL fold metallo-hydrolase [Chloroflexota bacterium]
MLSTIMPLKVQHTIPRANTLRLQHICGNVYYLPGPSNVGLIVGNNQQALLIDTGVGRRSGCQLLQILRERDLDLVAVINTHCHGDHVGGNAYLVQQTGARVYAPVHDAVALQEPLWGAICSFVGADPVAEMRAPRFDPQPCAVDVLVTEGELEIAGVTVQAVALPGHTASHTGYMVNDVFFTGDILAGEEELANTAISYAYSITHRLQSLEKLRDYSSRYYVLGHGPARRDVSTLIDRNVAQINEVLEFVKAYLTQGCVGANELLQAVCARYAIYIRNLR